MEYLTVALLARELGLRPNEVMQLAEKVGVRVTRVAAKLSQAQADRIRGRVSDDAERAARAAAKSRPAPAPIAAGGPAVATVRADHPRVGPEPACACCGMNIGARRRSRIKTFHPYVRRASSTTRSRAKMVPASMHG
jgi:hypothetical protein